MDIVLGFIVMSIPFAFVALTVMYSKPDSHELDTWRLVVRDYPSETKSIVSSSGPFRIEFRPRFITWLGGRREPFVEYGDFGVSVEDRGIALTYLDPKPELRRTTAEIPWSAILHMEDVDGGKVLTLARPRRTAKIKVKVDCKFGNALGAYVGP
jgi:hypothetical protein